MYVTDNIIYTKNTAVFYLSPDCFSVKKERILEFIRSNKYVSL